MRENRPFIRQRKGMKPMDFVPFYKHENRQRVKPIFAKKNFPNYLNAAPPSSSCLEEREKREMDYAVKPDLSREVTHRKEYTAPFSYQEKQPALLAKEDKLVKRARIRQELKKFQAEQSKRPFRPTQVPSIWQGDYHQPVDDKKSFPLLLDEKKLPKSQLQDDIQPKEEVKKAEIKKDFPKSSDNLVKNKIKAPLKAKKRHLNRDLQSIMAHERPIESHAFVERVTRDSKLKPPFQEKKLNGESKQNE